ncbi:MAG: sigma-70 family RNA polymerase sigma factor [Myxococcota bacterium]|nr:sigma-70 family RNA polymerase sigma factor [Myxococcota bacterium]
MDAAAAQEAVLAVARSQDRAAFAALFAHFAPRVKGYLIKRGVENASADEIVQDVMLTVWTKARYFDPARGGVSTWLFTVARNSLIDRVRRERRPEYDPLDPALVDEPAGPDVNVERSRFAALLKTALAELPEEQAQVVAQVYGEGKSLSDVATATNTPLGTVKTRMRLALARLRTRMPSDDGKPG